MNIFLDANICLDLIDSTRATSKKSVQWYFAHKDDEALSFYFSADFITTIYYILTQKRKINSTDTLAVIDELSTEINPHYLIHNDFLSAKNAYLEQSFKDFEDLLILQSASRLNCAQFISNDKVLLKQGQYLGMDIIKP